MSAVEPGTSIQRSSQTQRQTALSGSRDADALRVAITRTARRLRQEAGSGLSPTLLVTLASIDRHEAVTPGELARIEGVRRPTVTRVIKKLVDAGLVERREDPEDRRSAQLFVSAEGRQYLAENRSRKSAWLAKLIDDMPEEEARTLSQAAEILTRALEGHQTGEIRLPGDS